MDDLEGKLSAIMNDPDMMGKIMAMAQNLGQSQPEAPPSPMPDIDIGLLQKLSSFAGKSSIDTNQRNLLQALTPYLNHSRISRLEKAMRAAKMASLATTLLPMLAQGR